MRLLRNILPHPEKDLVERRIVLLGKTGAGKSAAGNTMLREKHKFRSKLSSSSVTKHCKMEKAVVAGRRVCGLFDTEMSPEDLAVELGMSVYLSSPGPHAFLYVQTITGRFTQQEEEVVNKLEQMFGEEMRKYTIILFTHGDQLKGESVENLITENKSLSTLVDQCGGYHVFNNKHLRNKQQVTELLQKIDRMVERNGGSCYTNEMFVDAANSSFADINNNLPNKGNKPKPGTFWDKWGKHLLIGAALLCVTAVGAGAFLAYGAAAASGSAAATGGSAAAAGGSAAATGGSAAATGGSAAATGGSAAAASGSAVAAAATGGSAAAGVGVTGGAGVKMIAGAGIGHFLLKKIKKHK